MKKCDLLVIGGGSGGVRAARFAAATGARVILVEKAALGGTCVNVGCVPKKLFTFAAGFSEERECAAAYGWRNAGGEMDWNVLRENKNREIARLNEIYAGILKDANVEVINAEARLSGEKTAQCGDTEIHADKILLATGATPSRPDMPGAAMGVLSDDMFYLPSLPRRAAVLGGGYIALEFAGILSGLGVETTLCYRADLPLRGFDDDLREHMAAEVAKRGVKIQSGNAPVALEKYNDALQVRFADGDALTADLALFATGRRPLTDNIGLEEHAGVTPDGRGFLSVDDDYRVKDCPWLYAIGDIIQTPALTPVATAEAGAFVSRVYKNDKTATVDYAHLPTAVFSRPQMGTVGMSESAAAKKDIRIRTYKSVFRAMKRSFAGKDWETLIKLVVDADSGKVLGAHYIGDDAGEIIQGFAVALRMGATKADFDATIGVHPTSAEEFVSLRED